MSRLRSLLTADARNIAREPPLWASALLPWVFALGLRFGFVDLVLLASPWVDLELYRLHIAAFLLVTPAMMIGWVVGFLLLDERDEKILAAIEVTPLGRGGFVRYRMVLPTVLAILVALAVHLCAGLVAPGLVPVAAAILLSSLAAPLLALFLVAFASNKVEGLAMAKLGSLMVFLPLLAAVVGGRWWGVAHLLPGAWSLRVFSGELTGLASLAAIACGLALSVGYGAWLLRRIGRQIER